MRKPSRGWLFDGCAAGRRAERSGDKAKLNAKTIVVLDEAGIVGSKEFFLLQRAVLDAGGQLVAVVYAKQLKPIAAGGIFRALCERRGRVEISNIQRQRTDFGPLLDWPRSRGNLTQRAAALRTLPEDAKLGALESLCAVLPKLSGRSPGGASATTTAG